MSRQGPDVSTSDLGISWSENHGFFLKSTNIPPSPHQSFRQPSHPHALFGNILHPQSLRLSTCTMLNLVKISGLALLPVLAHAYPQIYDRRDAGAASSSAYVVASSAAPTALPSSFQVSPSTSAPAYVPSDASSPISLVLITTSDSPAAFTSASGVFSPDETSSSSSVEITTSDAPVAFTSTLAAAPSSSTVAVVLPTGPPTSKPSVNAFNYLGCYLDLVNNTRSLNSGFSYDPEMTLEICATNCANYDFFGTEYGSECYCGYTLDASFKTAEAECTSACDGDASELCGTNARLSVYQNTVITPVPPPTTHKAYVNGMAWQGCFTESAQLGLARSLSNITYADDSMTVESCTAFCAGNLYAGVEYGRECYCANELTTSTAGAQTSDCYIPCYGNSSEYCGGPNRLDIYKVGPPPASPAPLVPAIALDYTMVGCYKETKTGHALPLLAANKSITPDFCKAIVRSLAAKPTPTIYPFFAVENKQECYGGTSLGYGAAPITSLIGTKACTATCSGNRVGRAKATGTAKCGGSKQYNLYAAVGVSVPAAKVTKVA